jgi:hypothetical protein
MLMSNLVPYNYTLFSQAEGRAHYRISLYLDRSLECKAIGTIVGSTSLNPNAEEFGLSGLNRTQAGGLVENSASFDTLIISSDNYP